MARAADDETPPPHADDLLFARACARGDAAALQRFDRELTPVMVEAARRFGPPDFAHDVAQAVRQRLLVAEGGGATRIAGYQGQGPLSAFVQAVTVRVALNQLESAARHAPAQSDDALLRLPDGGDDPEVAVLKQRYRAEFKVAFASALATLSDEARSALQLYYLDALTLADVGRLFGWSVPTASRRLADSRAALLAATRTAMGEQLKLTPREVDSVLRLIESRLSVDGLLSR